MTEATSLQPPAREQLSPPRSARSDTRKVGVEIEFAGISARRAAVALASELGGSVVEEDPHAFLVRGTRLGNLAVELDLRHTHPQRSTATRLRLGPRSAAWLGSVLRHVVPTELVFAPLPAFRLAEIDQVIAVLRRAGATGRGTTLFASLGLHFNVEASHLDAQAITAVLKAFALLEPWLRRKRLKSTHEWLTRMGERYPEGSVAKLGAG